MVVQGAGPQVTLHWARVLVRGEQRDQHGISPCIARRRPPRRPPSAAGEPPQLLPSSGRNRNYALHFALHFSLSTAVSVGLDQAVALVDSRIGSEEQVVYVTIGLS